MITIDVARDFSETPGGRLREDGDFSAEEFFENHLDPVFSNSKADEKVEILMDGGAGFAASFVDEAFRRLGEKYGLSVLDKLNVVTEDHYLKSEVIAAVIDPNLTGKVRECVQKFG